MAGRSSITGVDQTVKALRELGADVAEPAGALDRIATEGEEAAQRRTPRRSGRLVRSVRGEREGLAAVVTAGGPAVLYAGPINYGWRRHNIRPAGFLEAGGQRMEETAADLLEDYIDASIKERGLG